MTEQTDKPTAPEPAAVRDAVTRQAVLDALYDEVKKARDDARRTASDLLEKQYKAGGSTKTDATLPDGTKVGSVSRQGGERAAQVIDTEAFRVWVRDTYPSEHVVEVIPAKVVTAVRPGFSSKVLAEATAAGVARYVDPETGELHDVPGVEILPSRAASHRLTYTRGSKAQPTSGRELVAARGVRVPSPLTSCPPSPPPRRPRTTPPPRSRHRPARHCARAGPHTRSPHEPRHDQPGNPRRPRPHPVPPHTRADPRPDHRAHRAPHRLTVHRIRRTRRSRTPRVRRIARMGRRPRPGTAPHPRPPLARHPQPGRPHRRRLDHR